MYCQWQKLLIFSEILCCQLFRLILTKSIGHIYSFWLGKWRSKVDGTLIQLCLNYLKIKIKILYFNDLLWFLHCSWAFHYDILGKFWFIFRIFLIIFSNWLRINIVNNIFQSTPKWWWHDASMGWASCTKGRDGGVNLMDFHQLSGFKIWLVNLV